MYWNDEDYEIPLSTDEELLARDNPASLDVPYRAGFGFDTPYYPTATEGYEYD